MIARRSSEVCTTSGGEAGLSQQYAATLGLAWGSVRGTSTQPVKRFSAFQVLSPWRSRTRVWGTGSALAPGDARVGLRGRPKLALGLSLSDGLTVEPSVGTSPGEGSLVGLRLHAAG